MAGRKSSTGRRRFQAWLVTVNKPGKNDGSNWILRYRSPTGEVVPRSSGVRDRAEAERMAAAEQSRLNGESGQPETVLNVYDLHLAELEAEDEVAPATISNYRSARAALLPLIEQLPVDRLTPEAIDRIRRGMRGKSGQPLRPSTVKVYVQQLAAAWAWAYEHPSQTGVTTPWVAPRQRRRKTTTKAKRTNKRPLEVAELVELLAAAASTPWWPILWTLADTGARVSEVLLANAEDLAHDAEGRAWLQLTDTKTGIPRDVPLLEDTVDLISPAGPGPLIRAPKGGRANRSAVNAAMRRLLAKAGVDNTPETVHGRRVYPLDVHSLRRSWIAHSERAGVPRPVAMLITGHEPQGVHDAYGRNATGDDLHAALKRIRTWRDAQGSRPGFAQPRTLDSSVVSLSGKVCYASGSTARESRSEAPQSPAGPAVAGSETGPPGPGRGSASTRSDAIRCPTCGQLARPPPPRWPETVTPTSANSWVLLACQGPRRTRVERNPHPARPSMATSPVE